MREFRKVFNPKIVLIVIATLFFINSAVYARDLSETKYLRNPVLSNDSKKLKERFEPILFNLDGLQGLVEKSDEAIRRKEFFDDLKSGGKEFKRRKAKRQIMAGKLDTRPVPTTDQAVKSIQEARSQSAISTQNFRGVISKISRLFKWL